MSCRPRPANIASRVTPPNGYRFPSQVSYTQLPPDRNLVVTGPTSGGSYGNPFHVSGAGVVLDVPLDTAAQAGLFVQKDASRSVVELGDFVDYTVRVRNGTGNVLNRADVTLTDNLPAGFAFVAGTARRDNALIADPAGGKGPRSHARAGPPRPRPANHDHLPRARGPGAMQGDGVNRVQARYALGSTVTLSNIATALVKVTGGVFSDKGFILGKVFMDCNANGVQDKGEQGVPGVRLMLEDGTYVITDGGGKYSFYGISNRTHVVKADRTTLPGRRAPRSDQRAQPGRRGQPHRRPQVGRDAARRLRHRRLRRGRGRRSEVAPRQARQGRRVVHPRRHPARDRGAGHHRCEGASGERRGRDLAHRLQHGGARGRAQAAHARAERCGNEEPQR